MAGGEPGATPRSGRAYRELVRPDPFVRDLQAIVAAYEQLDTHLEGRRSAAATGEGGRDRIAQMQRINDQAYFVLAWGQFESSVEDACRDAIRSGQAQRDWKSSRVWSLYNPDDRRLSGLRFEDRLALVLEKGARIGDGRCGTTTFVTRSLMARCAPSESK